jgi:hypothetical protein
MFQSRQLLNLGLVACTLLCISPLFAKDKKNVVVEKAASPTSYRFNEYKVDFPGNWQTIPDSDLKSYLGYYQRSTSTSPYWSDPSFVRGWSEVGAKNARLSMCTIYKTKNDRKLARDVYVQAILERYSLKDSGMKDVKVQANGEAVISGSSAKWFDVQMVTQDQKIKVRHYVFIVGEQVYYFYFSTTPKHFSKVQGQFESIAKSFNAQ